MALGPTSVFLVAVSFVAPVATPSYVDAHVAQVSYVQPVFNASYIEAKVQAEVSFPDVLGVEIITPTDLVALTVDKNLQDELITTELLAALLAKPFTDDANIADSFNSINTYIRSYVDSTTSSDLAVLLSQLDKQESLTTSDSNTNLVSKPLSEGLTLTDNMDGILQYEIVKTTSDSVIGSDSYAVAFSTAMADNASLGSSGLLIVQDYADITYFLEDYVGFSTSFT